MQTNMMVSIICLAYNHEKYIRETLDGFVSQKTNFPFEVIIHDDASRDHTADIIREYEEKYPNIIKPIYQSQNQYSQGTNIYKEYVLPKMSGKYVAFCEGDDFWSDSNKLQKQVAVMEQNPDCSLCVHKVAEIYEDGTANGTVFPSTPVNPGKMSSRDFFKIGRQYSFHTSSYFFRMEHFREYVLNPPEFTKKCDVGDEVYMLFFGHLGKIYYHEEMMSCYRRGVAGSWSVQNLTNVEKQISHGKHMIETLAAFDEHTKKQYHDICVQRIARQLSVTAVLEKSASRLLKRENREYWQCLSLARKLYIFCSAVMPTVMQRVYIHRVNVLNKKRGVK